MRPSFFASGRVYNIGPVHDRVHFGARFIDVRCVCGSCDQQILFLSVRPVVVAALPCFLPPQIFEPRGDDEPRRA